MRITSEISLTKLPRPSLCIQRLRHLEQLEPLAPAWDCLARQVSLPTAHFIWADAAASAFRAKLQVVLIQENQTPIAIAPLASETIHGVPHAVLLGVSQLHEPMDLLYHDAAALDRLAHALLSLGRPLYLARLPADSPTIAAFQRLAPRRALIFVRPHPACPHIPLDDSWHCPEDHLNSGRRSDLRRARRHAEQIGPLATEILTPSPSQLDSLLDLAYEIEAKSWKGQSGTALLHDPPLQRFYRQYAHAAARAGVLRLCFLRIGGQAAAMQIALQCDGSFWLLKIGYDQRYAKCSPGQLLLLETLRHAAGANLRSYELLGCAAPWTQVWTQRVRPCVSLWVYPFSVSGLAALGARAAVAWVQRGRRALLGAAGRLRPLPGPYGDKDPAPQDDSARGTNKP